MIIIINIYFTGVFLSPCLNVNLQRIHSRVELFSLFFIFENGHIAIDCLYFYELISEESANFAARQNFHFQKITLKINIFFKLPETFLLHKRTIFKNRIQNYNLFSIYFIFQKWQKRFLTLKIV